MDVRIMSKMDQLKSYFRNTRQKTWGIKKECKELGKLEIYEPMPNVVQVLNLSPGFGIYTIKCQLLNGF